MKQWLQASSDLMLGSISSSFMKAVIFYSLYFNQELQIVTAHLFLMMLWDSQVAKIPLDFLHVKQGAQFSPP